MATRGSKIANRVYPWVFCRSRQLLLNKFFNPRSSSMRKGCYREEEEVEEGEKNGENSSSLTSLPVNHLNCDRLQRWRAKNFGHAVTQYHTVQNTSLFWWFFAGIANRIKPKILFSLGILAGPKQMTIQPIHHWKLPGNEGWDSGSQSCHFLAEKFCLDWINSHLIWYRYWYR